MSDVRLRELERRWRESGELEHQVAWLRARLRAGTLAHERAELAAWCGQPAARAVLEWPADEVAAPILLVHAPHWVCEVEGELPAAQAWAAELLRRAGPEGAARAACAAARASVWWAREGQVDPELRRLQAAVAAVEAWLGCPCEDCRDRVRTHAEGEVPLARAVAQAGGGDARLLVAAVAALAMDRHGHTEPWRTHIEEAIRAALSEWALGDPRAAPAGELPPTVATVAP